VLRFGGITKEREVQLIEAVTDVIERADYINIWADLERVAHKQVRLKEWAQMYMNGETIHRPTKPPVTHQEYKQQSVNTDASLQNP
jgi:hypothetical protein